MHAIKGGWVGQTFALAKWNDSGGRKSRIRRSKEERKEMVKSFIKKYQSLNNGNFPSLNLTHKEVGGSFYTIREIVREVIQENRVLGPAKLLPEEQITDQLLEQFPLGTISTEPEISLTTSPNGSPFVAEQYCSTSEEPDLISGGLYAETEQQGFDNGQIINGSHVIAEKEEYDGHKVAEVQVIGPLEMEKSVEEAAVPMAKVTQMAEVITETFPSDKQKVAEVQAIKPLEMDKSVEEVAATRAKVTQMAEVIVETFPFHKQKVAEVQVKKPLDMKKSVEEVGAPTAKVTQMVEVIVETVPLQPLTTQTAYVDGNSAEGRDLDGTLEEKDSEVVHLVPGSNNSLPDGISSSENSCLADNKEVETSAIPLLEEKAAENLANPPLGSSNLSPIKESMMYDTQADIDVEVNLSHNDKVGAETEVVHAPNGTQAKTLNGTYASNGSGKSITQEGVVITNKADVKIGSLQKGSNPTLDRINLESWEGAPRNHAEPENNPLWVIFRQFIDALVKFWSE